jgi:hypothetical protein
VKAAVRQFDRDNAVLEGALRELFAAWPGNTNEHHVYLKVTALNTLYSTRMPVYSPQKLDLGDVTEHICRNGRTIDQALADDRPEVVDRIAHPEANGKPSYHPWSFATKYASWHRPLSYPIWDTRVRAYLLWLQEEHDFNKDFGVDDWWKYGMFRKAISGLRTQYGLEEFSFKDLDKFMWQAGDVVMEKKETHE